MKNRTYVRFGIYDFNDISHSEITEKLGISPTKIHVKGEKKSVNSKLLWKKNAWMFNSPLDEYTSFELQMNSMVDIIEPKIHLFKPFCEKYYCEFGCALFIYCGENEESSPWVHLNSRYNKLIQELNIEFDLDLYCIPITESPTTTEV